MTTPYRFSRIAQASRPSPIRELFRMTQRPGMISFAGGLPDPAIFPIDEFAECAGALREHGRIALQYGATEGYRPLVETVAERMTAPLGLRVGPERVVIASGSQQVMDMLARVLLDPGDVVLLEAPTYPGALHTFRAAGARFAPIPCDAGGMRVELLPEVIERCRRAGGAEPKFIYTIDNFSNPSGACLALERRTKLIELAKTHGIPIFEDDPYGELRYRGQAAPSLFSLAGGQGVLYASSFSKILAPGVRVAWAVGEPDLVRKMVIAKQGMDLCSSMVAQVLVAEYCRRGFLDRHLGRIREHYARKAEAMGKALAAHLRPGSATWTDPDGGFFFWLRLAGLDSLEVFTRAVDEGVAFLPGQAFFPDTGETAGEGIDGSPFARLCFTFAGPREIDEGARRLARAIVAP